MKELRDEPRLRHVITAVLKGDNDRPVKLPHNNAHYILADFVIDDGYLKLVKEECLAKIVPKSQRETIVRDAY